MYATINVRRNKNVIYSPHEKDTAIIKEQRPDSTALDDVARRHCSVSFDEQGFRPGVVKEKES